MRAWPPSQAPSLRPCRRRRASQAAGGDDRSGLAGLWLLLAPLACCGAPVLIAGLAAAGTLAWGGIGLAVAVLLAAGVLVIRRRRRACLSPGRCGAAVAGGDPRGDR
jgi:Flp pilus assembly protein TadB